MERRLVIKVGTKVLSTEDGYIDTDVLSHIVEQISAAKREGNEVILVTSGAVGAGKRLVSQTESLSEVVKKQVLAAVGQVHLMNTYAGFFQKHTYVCAQVLATKEDFRDEGHYTNMKNCLEGLIHDQIIPIVNENDVVATAELMFTDNDELAGLIAIQLNADALIILTSVDGLLDETGTVISHIQPADVAIVEKHVYAEKTAGGRGGMQSKFAVAKELSSQGIVVHIANGKTPRALTNVLSGEHIGTTFHP